MNTRLILRNLIIFATLATGGPALAQDITTGEAARDFIIANGKKTEGGVILFEYNGRDRVYFTQIKLLRCAFEQVVFVVNNEAEPQVLSYEPCYTDDPAPNHLKGMEDIPDLIRPLGSIRALEVSILYEDGITDSFTLTRRNLMWYQGMD